MSQSAARRDQLPRFPPPPPNSSPASTRTPAAVHNGSSRGRRNEENGNEDIATETGGKLHDISSPPLHSPLAEAPLNSRVGYFQHTYPFLEENSYTAHKLYHATPEHIHVASRRVFIGPVPEGWLKNHRHEWFKERVLHVNYSKRSGTWNWARGVGGDGGDENINLDQNVPPLAKNLGRTYCQGGEDLIDMTEELEGGSDGEGEQPGPESVSRHDQSVLDVNGKGKGKESGSRNLNIPKTPKTPNTPGQESWQTASEIFEDARDQQPLTRVESQLRQQDQNGNISATSSNAGGRSFEAVGSLASLLSKHDITKDENNGIEEASTKKIRKPLLKHPLLPKSKSKPSGNPVRDAGPRVSTNQDKVAGGMVRFNTAVLTHERDKQMQLKLAELSRRRSLRRGGGCPRRHREGEIIKMENMLARVDYVKGPLSDNFDENESVKYEMKTIERWKEFIVVCREGGTGRDGNQTFMSIQLYKTRTVPAVDRIHVSSSSRLIIPLDRKVTRINLFSSLDKTLTIWHPHGSHTVIYILKPRCTSSSAEWYTFLRAALGWKRPNSLQIFVPDLGVTLTIDQPFAKVEQKLASREAEDRDIIREEEAIAGEVIHKSIKILQKCKRFEDVLQYWEKKERMGLAWRRYDRLEWIHGVNEQRMYGTIGMQRTHQLELRPKIHYPTLTEIPGNARRMTQPPAVEGFLIRLSPGKGDKREYKNLYFAKRYYWTVHDHLFFYCRPTKALPPPPPNLESHKDGTVPPTSHIIGRIPKIFEIIPYPLNEDGEISWLHEGTKKLVDEMDIKAYQEAERNVNTVLRAEGFIDLSKVERVQLVKKLINANKVDSDPATLQQSDRSLAEGADVTTEGPVHHEKIFEIVLKSGVSIKFQAQDELTRDEWVKRLDEILEYWKYRELDDVFLIKETKQSNMKELHVDEEMEAVIGQFARKWEVALTTPCPILYNTCGFASCRTVAFTGYLYRKLKKPSTFVRYYAVLCHGELIMFQDSPRRPNGKKAEQAHQERYSSIDLQDCFLYSGIITNLELVHHSEAYDTNGPVRNALPRIYEDGLTSQDEDCMLCFVLWHGKKRACTTRVDSQGNTVHKFGTKFGVELQNSWSGGKATVFKAPSRMLRDAWVVNISMEIERSYVKGLEDIKIKP